MQGGGILYLSTTWMSNTIDWEYSSNLSLMSISSYVEYETGNIYLQKEIVKFQISNLAEVFSMCCSKSYLSFISGTEFGMRTRDGKSCSLGDGRNVWGPKYDILYSAQFNCKVQYYSQLKNKERLQRVKPPHMPFTGHWAL